MIEAISNLQKAQAAATAPESRTSMEAEDILSTAVMYINMCVGLINPPVINGEV